MPSLIYKITKTMKMYFSGLEKKREMILLKSSFVIKKSYIKKNHIPSKSDEFLAVVSFGPSDCRADEVTHCILYI